jgi:hypothetical protein
VARQVGTALHVVAATRELSPTFSPNCHNVHATTHLNLTLAPFTTTPD